MVAACLDEAAFLRSEESAEPDIELRRALLPAMSTVPGSLLLTISSPYSKKGLVWQQYRKHYGEPGDVLVWQAPSRAMNRTLPARVVEEAMRDDPEAARAEWLGLFREDVATFVSPEVVEAVTIPGRVVLPPQLGIGYHSFVDAAGGSGSDADPHLKVHPNPPKQPKPDRSVSKGKHRKKKHRKKKHRKKRHHSDED